MASATVQKQKSMAKQTSMNNNKQPPIHTMVRHIGAAAGVGGVQPVEVVDADVSRWLADGYELKSTHFIGLDSGVFDMLYVLEKGRGAKKRPAAMHTIVRRIGVTDGVGGVQSVESVDADLAEWYKDGYSLHSTHFIGLDSGVFNVMYVLVK